MDLMSKWWLPVTGSATILLGLVWTVLRGLGALPAADGQVAYPLLLAYYYGALPVSILVMTVLASIFFWWLPLALVRRLGWTSAVPWLIGMTLAFIGSVWSAWPLISVQYREIAQVEAGGAVYHLGARVGVPGAGDNAWIVLRCPGGLVCDLRYLADASTERFDPFPVLSAAGGGVQVMVDDRVLFQSP